MAENVWYEQLENWVDEDASRAEQLKTRIQPETLRHWIKGRVASNLDRINLGTRAFLYSTTGLEVFNFDGYVNPTAIDVSEVLSGNQPRESLSIWLGYHGKSKEGLSKDAGVDSQTVKKYINGDDPRGSSKGKIERQLMKYDAEIKRASGKIASSKDLGSKVIESGAHSGDLDLGSLASAVHGLSDRVNLLGAHYEPTEQDRRTRIANAIDILSEEMQHYASVSKKERKKLIDHMEDEGLIDVYGWADNVFRGLLTNDLSPEAFARAVPAPERRRKRK